jgi:hypothetical protein
MGRNKADFQNQVAIHRGLGEVSIDGANLSGVGIHWTPSKDIAGQFAVMGDREEGEEGGVVLHGSVDPKHVVQRGTPEWEDYAQKHDIFDEEDDNGEKEVTVRKGAPVKIHGYTDIAPDDMGGLREQQVMFDKPKKAKA